MENERKRPCKVHISKDAHKLLKIMSANKNKPMCELVERLIAGKEIDSDNNWLKKEIEKAQSSLFKKLNRG